MAIMWMLVVRGKDKNGLKTGYQQPISAEIMVHDEYGFIADLDPDFKPFLIEKWSQIVPNIERVGLAKFELHDDGSMDLLEEEILDKNILAYH